MSANKIRSQVLIPLTLTFIILTGSFIYTSYRIRMDDYERGLEHRYKRVQHILKSLVADRTTFMTSTIEFIADQKQFQDAMRTVDRSALLKHGTPILERLFRQQQITHFYFYDKNGDIVLRVYHPHDLTASPPRFTKQQAMKLGKTVSGLELGRSGTFTLRVVYPWRINGELLGYMELGQEFDQILQDLRVITLIDFVVSIDKKHLEKRAWEEGMKMMGRNADWNLLPDRVLIDQTLQMPFGYLINLVDDAAVFEKQGKKLQFNERIYRARSFPMKDVAEQTVGKFILLHDLTESVLFFRVFIIQVLFFSMLLCIALFAYSYKVLGRVDRRLLENRERLRMEFEKQTATNQKLECEISERRRVEESLVRLNETLEQRVLERTSRLNEMNIKIEASNKDLEIAYKDLQAQQATILQQDKMACIGQLAASVAHDINNPIGFVAGNLEMLRRYWSKVLEFIKAQQVCLNSCASEEQLNGVEQSCQALKIDYITNEFDAMLAESLEGTDRVSRTVLNLKGFSRLDETEIRLADIHECLESTIGIIWNELRYKADIQREYGNIPLIDCFPQQLNQVFMNLLINASQSIEHWGKIKIRTFADAENIHIAISDTGCGIPVDNLRKIFEPFFTTKEAGIGTGLGLRIVHDIIKNHHGDITVESEINKGTEFTIRIPLKGFAPETKNV